MRSVDGMADAELRFVVGTAGQRLDRLVADATGLGRRTAQRLLAEGRVRVAGRKAVAAEQPAAGAEVCVLLPRPDTTGNLSALRILVETDELLVLDKPAGMHSEAGRSTGSMAGLLEARYGDLSGIGDRANEAGLVHRLDQQTSGVLLAARTAEAYRRLRLAFGAGRTRKQYLALAAGRLERSREIALPLARRAGRMVSATAHDASALPARTRFEPLELGRDWSLLLVTMRSGVMHQVRAHAAALGHPLLGDVEYGGPPARPGCRDGQMLHALRVQVDGEVDASVGPPGDFLRVLAAQRRG